MRGLLACALLVALAVTVSSVAASSQSPAGVARPLQKVRIDPALASPARASKLDLSGKYWYLDRDKKLPHLPATLACVGGCATSTPRYKATFTGISGIVFGVLDLNSNFVGFGQGPAPAIVGGCKDNNFTIIIESDRAVSNVFAAYSPCGSRFEGGASIYTRNEGGFWASLKRDLMNDVRIWKQVPGNVTGRYNVYDRNVASYHESLSISCVQDCATKTPTYRGVFAGTQFNVKSAPNGYVLFGTLDVKQGGAVCGQADFTLIVPPTGLAGGAAFLAAARPLPACGFTGLALRIEA